MDKPLPATSRIAKGSASSMVVVTRCCGVGWIFVVVDTGGALEDLNAWIAPTRRVSGSSEHTP
jgi:hypothetical protein